MKRQKYAATRVEERVEGKAVMLPHLQDWRNDGGLAMAPWLMHRGFRAC